MSLYFSEQMFTLQGQKKRLFWDLKNLLNENSY